MDGLSMNIPVIRIMTRTVNQIFTKGKRVKENGR